MKPPILAALLFLSTLGCTAPAASDELLPLAAGQIELAPSFEACSYYFRPSGHPEPSYVVEYRRAGSAVWQTGFAPVSDSPAGIWKGSIFDLAEDTVWELRVRTANGAEVLGPREFRTWSSQPPIAKVIDLSRVAGAAGGCVISDQGTPDGWIKYTAPRGWRLERADNPADAQTAAIEFRGARFVILEGVTMIGGARHGISVQDSEAVRILNCDISGWGRVGVQQFSNTGARGKYADARGELINYDAGIEISRSARTVVERCFVHDPRGRANSWMFSHPAGPTAVYANRTRGGSVLRWNDFVGSDEHRWNDVIESSNNSAADGGFFRDSDISGNFLAYGNDDGVELEGGGMNVRFYRNKIEGTVCSISTGACILGPQFVYGNLVTNPGDEAGLALWYFKNSHGAEQGGKRHFVNNTLCGADPGVYGGYGKPAGVGRIGFMRNNIFVGSAARLPGDWARRDDFDHDLFWSGNGAAGGRAILESFRAVGQEAHGLPSDPLFVLPASGDFHLQPQSPARGHAAAVANLASTGGNLGALADDSAEVPFRPLELRAVPRQLNFLESGRTAQLEVTLSVPKTARATVPFEIRQNRVFRWFTVQPAAGTVAPGETVKLRVTVDPAALRGRSLYRGAFLVRTPAGLSRPVSVYAHPRFLEDLRPTEAADSAFVTVADLPDCASRVRPTTAPNVTGGKYVAFSGAEGNPELVSQFVLPRNGRYALLARASIGPDVMRKRSLAVALDREKEPTRVAINSDYQWNTGATHFRVIFLHALGELAAGEHSLRWKVQSGDLNLNELIITDHPAAFFIDHWQREAN